MAGDTVTFALGGLVALLFLSRVVFLPKLASSRVRASTFERLLALFSEIGMATGGIGWLMCWFTEEAIWSPAPRNCSAFASIELKGQVYKSCSYLVHRYQAGEWLFVTGIGVMLGAILVGKLSSRRAEARPSE